MQTDAARARARRHIARRGTDVYPVALASVAVFCLTITLAVLIFAPKWDTLVFDLPLGAYLLGGLGGLLTIVLCPGWARRLGSRYRGRAVMLTFYRMGSAMMLGGVGYLLVDGLDSTIGLVTPTWFRFAFALATGVGEMLINEIVLRGLGFLAPREIDPRLL